MCVPRGHDGETFIERMSIDEEVQRDKLIALLDKVAQHGPQSVKSDRNHLVDPASKLWQFRVDHIRVLYFYDEGFVVVCAHLYGKKSQKAPPGEIAAARKVRDAYFAAKAGKKLKFSTP